MEEMMDASNAVDTDMEPASPEREPSDDTAATPTSEEQRPKQRRSRLGGSSVKTAEVWRFFSQLPHPEQAARCNICEKTIKATNSSTTGMIRHLRSIHQSEYDELQRARNATMIMKTLKSGEWG